MKRYTIKPEVTWSEGNHYGRAAKAVSLVEESADGEWVRWSEARAEIEAADARNPLVRIQKLEEALGRVSAGRCAECGEKVNGWNAPVGAFAPEAFATLREHGIDPGSGHRLSCSRKKG